jgi:hypothetical protein
LAIGILYTQLVDSLQDILSKRDFTPPDEVAAVKEFIARRYKSPSRVRVERDVLIVRVPSSALAATLQLDQRVMRDLPDHPQTNYPDRAINIFRARRASA